MGVFFFWLPLLGCTLTSLSLPLLPQPLGPALIQKTFQVCPAPPVGHFDQTVKKNLKKSTDFGHFLKNFRNRWRGGGDTHRPWVT